MTQLPVAQTCVVAPPRASWLRRERDVWRSMLFELVRYRELLWSLALREIRVRYKQSVLGVAWALLLPVAMMLIFTFVFTRAVPLASSVDIAMPYPIYAYIGLLPWIFFATSLTSAVNSLVANATLVTKIYFPREVFPFSCVISAMLDLLIGVGVLVGLAAYYGLRPEQTGGPAVVGGTTAGAWSFSCHWTLLAVPVVLGVQIALTLGLALILSMANLFYRDVRYVFSVVIQLWMFLTNVIYPMPRGNVVLQANPMTPILSAYRDLVVFGRLPDLEPSLYAVAVSLGIFLIGWRWFHAAEFKFAERI